MWGSYSFVEVFLKYIEAECDGGKEDQVQFCFQTNFSILWPPPTTTETDHFKENGPKIISSNGNATHPIRFFMVDKTNHSFKEEEKQFQRRAKSCPVKVLHMGSRACKFWICKFDSFETGRVLQFPSFFAFSQFQVFLHFPVLHRHRASTGKSGNWEEPGVGWLVELICSTRN